MRHIGGGVTRINRSISAHSTSAKFCNKQNLIIDAHSLHQSSSELNAPSTSNETNNVSSRYSKLIKHEDCILKEIAISTRQEKKSDKKGITENSTKENDSESRELSYHRRIKKEALFSSTETINKMRLNNARKFSLHALEVNNLDSLYLIVLASIVSNIF